MLNEVLANETRFPGFFDLLIVDEAHHCAPAGRRRDTATPSKASRPRRSRLSRAEPAPPLPVRNPPQRLLVVLAGAAGHARPAALLRGHEPDKATLEQIMVRRLKTEINNPDGPSDSRPAGSRPSTSPTPTRSGRRTSCSSSTPPPAASKAGEPRPAPATWSPSCSRSGCSPHPLPSRERSESHLASEDQNVIPNDPWRLLNRPATSSGWPKSSTGTTSRPTRPWQRRRARDLRPHRGPARQPRRGHGHRGSPMAAAYGRQLADGQTATPSSDSKAARWSRN